jgi:hypothetical protein
MTTKYRNIFWCQECSLVKWSSRKTANCQKCKQPMSITGYMESNEAGTKTAGSEEEEPIED